MLSSLFGFDLRKCPVASDSAQDPAAASDTRRRVVDAVQGPDQWFIGSDLHAAGILSRSGITELSSAVSYRKLDGNSRGVPWLQNF